jgi:hypothetical protein
MTPNSFARHWRQSQFAPVVSPLPDAIVEPALDECKDGHEDSLLKNYNMRVIPSGVQGAQRRERNRGTSEFSKEPALLPNPRSLDFAALRSG